MSASDPATATGDAHRSERGPGSGIYLAFVPWVLFSLITQHDTLKAAAVAALIAAVLIAAPAVLAGLPMSPAVDAGSRNLFRNADLVAGRWRLNTELAVLSVSQASLQLR